MIDYPINYFIWISQLAEAGYWYSVPITIVVMLISIVVILISFLAFVLFSFVVISLATLFPFALILGSKQLRYWFNSAGDSVLTSLFWTLWVILPPVMLSWSIILGYKLLLPEGFYSLADYLPEKYKA